MRRIACALAAALIALSLGTTAQAAKHPKKAACKTVKRTKGKAKKVRRCAKHKPAKPKRKPAAKPKQTPTATVPAPAPVPVAPVAPVTPPAPIPSDPGSAAPAGPAAPPAPVGPPSIAISPGGASTTSALTVTVTNLPASAPGEHYVVRLIGTSATATGCVFGVEIADVTAPATVTPSGAWCAGPWQAELLAVDADGDTDGPVTTVTFTITG